MPSISRQSGEMDAKCLILDDDELDFQQRISVLRQPSKTIEAIRIFGGQKRENNFPSAFRNPKKMLAPAPAATPHPLHLVTTSLAPIPKREVPNVGGYGGLIQSVRTMLGVAHIPAQPTDTWKATPEGIATRGVPLLPLDDLDADEDGDYAYAPCTPCTPPSTGPDDISKE